MTPSNKIEIRALEGKSLDEDEALIYVTRAQLRVDRSNALEIKSKIARFKGILDTITSSDSDDDSSNEPVASLTTTDMHEPKPKFGDIWKIVDYHGQVIPLGDSFLYEQTGFISLGSEISRRLRETPEQMIELVYLESWSQIPFPGSLRYRGFLDVNHVWVMIVLRNSNGIAEHIALTTIPHEFWEAANPQPSAISVI